MAEDNPESEAVEAVRWSSQWPWGGRQREGNPSGRGSEMVIPVAMGRKAERGGHPSSRARQAAKWPSQWLEDKTRGEDDGLGEFEDAVGVQDVLRPFARGPYGHGEDITGIFFIFSRAS